MKPTNTQQLEISLPAPAFTRRRAAKPCRPARAQWWFERMHRVVDAASAEAPQPAPVAQPVLPLPPHRRAA